MQQPPVDWEDHSGAEKVRVLVFELAGDILVGLQSPDPVVGAAIQLIQLSDKHNKSLSQQIWPMSDLCVSVCGFGTHLWEQSPQFQVHDVVWVELLQSSVVVLSEHGSVGDQAPKGLEGLLEISPYHILTGIHPFWVVVGEDGQVTHDAVGEWHLRLDSTPNFFFICMALFLIQKAAQSVSQQRKKTFKFVCYWSHWSLCILVWSFSQKNKNRILRDFCSPWI